MHDHGKSDRPVVPAKLPNKPVRAGAEAVEGRGLPKGNTASERLSGPAWQGVGRRAGGSAVPDARRAVPSGRPDI